MTNRLVHGESFVFRERNEFVGNVFRDCSFTLATECASPRFCSCVFIDCEFNPPMGTHKRTWSRFMPDCKIA